MKAITAGGNEVNLVCIGLSGRIYGDCPGFLTHTWWHADGTHNTFPDMNLSSKWVKEFYASEGATWVVASTTTQKER